MMASYEKLAQFRISTTRMPRDTFERVEASTELNILDFISENSRSKTGRGGQPLANSHELA
ncbi:hypothetical protein [Thalassomonas haliotis]|uniref:Uncharacterized protein n=1 Tax=Thalassomonas haliotis TaxID=485448 RepID=A0ABY7V937_9GAMM|nr:hypothetical protein [Thalassomonas haliotis]WDE09398.1 hypothetical protein H3N35_13730 [Thalassomonas haliotis]